MSRAAAEKEVRLGDLVRIPLAPPLIRHSRSSTRNEFTRRSSPSSSVLPRNVWPLPVRLKTAPPQPRSEAASAPSGRVIHLHVLVGLKARIVSSQDVEHFGPAELGWPDRPRRAISRSCVPDTCNLLCVA